jgi:chromate reductase, NAD(P)H dehydrogenase (quinone)
MKILGFAASLRKNSINHRLLERACAIAEEAGATLDIARFHEFDMPLYSGDLQDQSGFPAGAEDMAARINAADAMLIASPEFNFSLPGVLKNAIDWLSRMDPMPLRGQRALLLSASPSMIGGNRGLWQLRIPLEGLGCLLYPEQFSLARANEAYDAAGGLKDPALAARLDGQVRAFVAMVRALAGS